MPAYKQALLVIVCIFTFIGCAEVPLKTEEQSILLRKPIEEIRSEVMKILIFKRARIEQVNDNHIKAFFHSTTEAWYGDHGDGVDIWFEEQEGGVVRVFVDTSRRGNIWSSKLHKSIISELEKQLSDGN